MLCNKAFPTNDWIPGVISSIQTMRRFPSIDGMKLAYYYYHYYLCVARSYCCTTRLTMSRQFFLSDVSSGNLSNVCTSFEKSSIIPTLAKSCLTVCIQVVFGLPCGRSPFQRYSLRVFLAGVSGCKRMRCSSHISLLFLSISLHGSHFVLA